VRAEVIVREAGGVGDRRRRAAAALQQPDVGRPRGIITSNGLCHAELLQRLAWLYR
jgi:hypothetical protein